MKKIIGVVVCAVLICTFAVQSAFAKTEKETIEAPTLESISFNNADIVGGFSPATLDYDLMLDDSEMTPTLKSYNVSNGAELFVTYILNDAGKQKGINVEVKNSNVSTNYVFTYSNAKQYAITSNNFLKSLECRQGEVYPQINDKTTEYDLYIPEDATELQLNAVPQDIGAVCNVAQEIKLNADQNLTFDVTVTASDESVRVYTFHTKRIDKTSSEFEKIRLSDDFDSLVNQKLTYRNPRFKIVAVSVLAGVVFALLLAVVLKRLCTKPQDTEEKEFYDII